MHTPAANTARMRRALEHLHSQCSTYEAKDSFVKFQMQFAALQNLPELAKPIKNAKMMGFGRSSEESARARRLAEEARVRVEVIDHRDSAGKHARGARKISLLDRMLGRREKT